MNSAPGQNDAQQPTPYGSSGYGYPSQNSYATSGGMESGNEAYQSGTSYGYQRGSAYDNQDQSLNDAYTQNYYSRNNVRQTQPQSNAEGLSSLAYVSGLESANPRSSTSRNAQHRVSSPVDTNSRYSLHPSSSSTSYPMQQQASASSSSSQQLAVNAAAALAGAVSRRYSNQPQPSAANTSPSMTNVRSSAQSHPRRTASPQTATPSNSYQSYPSTQPQHQPQQQQQSAYRSYNNSSIYSATNAQAQLTPTNNPSAQTAKPSSSQSTEQRQSWAPARRNIQQTGSIANLVTTPRETDQNTYAQNTEATNSAPAFIDPTAIFDPYQRDRERKRLENEKAAADAKRLAEEAAKAEAEQHKLAEEAAQKKKQQNEAETQKRQTATKSASSKKQQGTAADSAGDEEVMATELKAMMEKMKAFQSKDPTLFKKLWADMRQPVPSATVASSLQSPSPQLAQQSLPEATPTAQPQPLSQTADLQDRNVFGRRKKAAKLGTDGQKLHLNGYPVVVENNPDGLPDLGRFPAERRIRPPKYIRKDKDVAEDTDHVVEGTSVPSPTSPPALGSAPAPISGHAPSSKQAQNTPAALAGAFTFSAETGSPTERSAPKQSSGTVWPLEKRNALTSTALRALKANHENTDISLTEDDLRKMLENNPSYITLCELLEQRGLKFHRGHFARELLNSVPDLKTPTPAPQSATPAMTARSAATAPSSSHTFSALPANQYPPLPPPPPPPARYAGPPPGYPPHPPPLQGNFVPAQPPPGPVYGQGILIPAVQGHPPPSASYKTPKPKGPTRPEPPPGSKEAAARKRDFSELIDLTELDDDDNYVVPDKHARLDEPDSDVEMNEDPFQAFQKQKQPARPQQHPPPPIGWFATPPVQQIHSNPHGYNSNTMRRQETFSDNKVDRMILAKTLNKNEALKKQYYDPRTVARDVLIASGRHPAERPLNVHLAGMLGKYIDLDSDVSTFDWDEIDPGGPSIPGVELVEIPATKPRFKMGERLPRKQKLPHDSVDRTRHPDREKRRDLPAPSPISKRVQGQTPSLESQPARFKNPSGLRHSLLASDEHATPATFDPTRVPPLLTSSKTPASTEQPAMEATPTARRRGRPPGSKNKYPSLGGLRDQAALAASGVKVNVPPRNATPPGKEKYKCKWVKCKTVLHNLDTLRKHIGRVHRPSPQPPADKEGYTCWWKKCQFLGHDDTGAVIATKAFKWDDWLKHIERDHIAPIAMKWGDGPSLRHVGKHS